MIEITYVYINDNDTACRLMSGKKYMIPPIPPQKKKFGAIVDTFCPFQPVRMIGTESIVHKGVEQTARAVMSQMEFVNSVVSQDGKGNCVGKVCKMYFYKQRQILLY